MIPFSQPTVFRSIRIVALPAILLAMSLSSCGSKEVQEQDVESTEKEMIIQERNAKKAVLRLGDYEHVDSISQNGHCYEYKITREADDSLGIVVDAEGFRSLDNYITLDIKRDGAPMFSKRFTRRAFKIGISDQEFSQYVLMNMVFDRITTSGLQFIVSVGAGSSDDMFVQYALTVGADGSTNIEPHEMFDEDEITRIN